jgi:hypothetical protein
MFIEDSYYYDTGCGRAFQFETDGPKRMVDEYIQYMDWISEHYLFG